MCLTVEKRSVSGTTRNAANGVLSCDQWPLRSAGSAPPRPPRRSGVTSRTLYRFIDEGQLVAYRFGRVIRLQESDVAAFIEASRIEPGTLEHLYPETAEHRAADA